MFTFMVQFMDLIYKGTLGLFFSFFIVSWFVWFVNLLRKREYKTFSELGYVKKNFSSSIIVPVYEESFEIWDTTLKKLKAFAPHSQVIVVQNGKDNGEASLARKYGFKTLVLPHANKREAVAEGAAFATGDITFILDSDTWIEKDTIEKMLIPFSNHWVGGATPRQEIFTRYPLFRRICDWLEDVRFHNTVMGQSISGAVSCLPGRFVAIRTSLLLKALPEFLNEKFLGVKCVTGDDRFLTSWLLKNRYKTVYQSETYVKTDSPLTLKRFAMQRLRWSRSSLRETLMSIPWIFNHPYTAFTLFSAIIIRWFYFTVIVSAVYGLINGTLNNHVIWQFYPSLDNTWFIIIATSIGFLLSGLLRQLGHLRRYPEDWVYLPIILLINTFVLLPIEWYGNLTCWQNKWMTRSV